jgi:hypothetical protein
MFQDLEQLAKIKSSPPPSMGYWISALHKAIRIFFNAFRCAKRLRQAVNIFQETRHKFFYQTLPSNSL